MSLFKERQASAKKLIQLQNEILALKAQLQDSQSSSKDCEDCPDCEDCTKLVQEVKSLLDLKSQELLSLEDEVASLKSDLKKIRSENTRLKNKLNKESDDV